MNRLGVVICVLLAAGPARAAAQAHPISGAAEQARRAWQQHDAAGLVASAATVVMQLPGADPAGALDRAHAAALLRDYFSGAVEVEVAVRSAREVEPGVGYVELARRFRSTGTQDLKRERLLIGYRLVGGRWTVSELKVVE